MSSLSINPYTLECDEGQRFQSLGATVLVKASTEQTGGAFNLLELTAPAGFATSLHIHYAEDVGIFVMEGTLTLYWGDQKKDAATGSYLFQPRGTPYGFRVSGGTRARLLYVTVPAGLDRLLREEGLPGEDCDPTALAARYKIEILGPLPE